MSKITLIPQNTFISFKGNKTKEQATLEKSNNCVNITDTGELYFNGKRLGTNDTEDKFFNSKAINTDGTINTANVKASDGKNIENYIQDKINTGVSGAYKFKKSIPSLSSAFRLNCQVGDIFNITNEFTITSGDHAGKYPAGTNVAVNTAFAGQTGGHDAQGKETYFDPLGGVVTDLSNYVTTGTLETAKTELGDRIDECAKTVDVKRDYLSKSDFNNKILDYNKTYVIKESQLPKETTDAGESAGEDILTFLMNIRNAIADNKYIIIQNDKVSSSSKGYYIIESASYKNNSFSLLYSYSHKNKVEIQVRLLGSTTQDPTYHGYSLKKIDTTLATSDDIQEIKDLLKLA